ncbi:MAG: hypothetical protein KatS3mg124_2159 [Porticoccaceae bacterium]|nr:MAG: hypothetical protein KatS3mg124_2159 [Porticoccaceae bacterium]
MAITITALRNGPFAVEGDLASLSLLDAQGNPFPVEPVEVGGVERVFLCRCGASEKKAVLRRHSRESALPGGRPRRLRAGFALWAEPSPRIVGESRLSAGAGRPPHP